MSPNKQRLNQMLHSASSSAHTSKDSTVDRKVCFTFLDIDDTSIALHNLSIKNAHVLLPILLYLNASQQQLGFMTNRPPKDNVHPYKVEWLREDLLEFGIEIPKEHVVFGGGPEKNQIKLEESRALDSSLATLNKLFDALKISEAGALIYEMNAIVKRLDSAKFEGKNIHILDFLGSHFDPVKNSYHFANNVCISKSDLKVILMDDLPNIADATRLLGQAFVGVQASRGGNPPKGVDNDDDFYTIGYLGKLASEVGLESYVASLLSEPKKHQNDNPMLQIAALLYQWQINTSSCSPKYFSMLASQLSDLQSEQIVGMLEYMMQMKHHERTGYHSVADVLSIFKQRKTDKVFLENVMRRYSVLENRIAILHLPVVDEEIPATVEPIKEKKSLFVRIASRGKTSVAPPVIASSSSGNLLSLHEDIPKMIALLEEKKRVLIERITLLASSPIADIAIDASRKLLSISSRSSDVVQNPSYSSASSGSSSSSSPRLSFTSPQASSSTASTTDPVLAQRRSFTPAAEEQASRSTGSLRAVSSLDSITDLEARAADRNSGKVQKKEKSSSKKAGSHK